MSGMLLAALLALFALRAAAFEELERIVAVVEEDVVLASELASRAEQVRGQMRAEGMTPPEDDVLNTQLLDRLILESIQVQMGERAGVRIDDETLTQAIANIARQNGMELFQFQQALAQQGMDYREFREDVRRSMIIQRVQQGAVGQRVDVNSEEIRAFLDSPLGRQVVSDEYRLGHILLQVPERASEAVERRRAAEAREIYEALENGADFREMAVTHSDGSQALEGGDLGWRRPGELPTLFGEEVLEMRVGDTAEPIRGSGGFHIIQLLDRRGAGVETAEQTHLRHILIRPSEIRSDEEAREMAEEVHARIEDGEDFAELARVFSEDPASAMSGGDLGWSQEDEFVPAFAEVMNATEPGEVSEPFETPFGWHILRVEDRRVQEMGEEARRDMAARVLYNRRFEEELEAWQSEIRDEAYVEVRR